MRVDFLLFTLFYFSEVKVIKDLQTNEQIRDREVRLIGSDGAQLGIMSARQAQQIADDAHLDLVKISPNSVPPVCKVMDYGKYRYEQNKREKEARKIKNRGAERNQTFDDNRRGRHCHKGEKRRQIFEGRRQSQGKSQDERQTNGVCGQRNRGRQQLLRKDKGLRHDRKEAFGGRQIHHHGACSCR